MGLIDTKNLSDDANQSGQKSNRSGCGQPPVRGLSDHQKTLKALDGQGLETIGQLDLESPIQETKKVSHRNRICTGSTVCRERMEAQERCSEVTHALR